MKTLLVYLVTFFALAVWLTAVHVGVFALVCGIKGQLFPFDWGLEGFLLFVAAFTAVPTTMLWRAGR
jgi:hypothetical protein